MGREGGGWAEGWGWAFEPPSGSAFARARAAAGCAGCTIAAGYAGCGPQEPRKERRARTWRGENLPSNRKLQIPRQTGSCAPDMSLGDPDGRGRCTARARGCRRARLRGGQRSARPCRLRAAGVSGQQGHAASVKIGTIQRRLAWPHSKDDTHKSRGVDNSFVFPMTPPIDVSRPSRRDPPPSRDRAKCGNVACFAGPGRVPARLPGPCRPRDARVPCPPTCCRAVPRHVGRAPPRTAKLCPSSAQGKWTIVALLGRGPHKNCKNDLDDQT